MTESFQPSPARTNTGLSVDFKRVLSRAIRFWYVVVFFLVGSVTIAVYKTRYSERVYPVTASIMIRETEETAGAELLFKNSLFDPYRNYLNEPYIIKSYPLIEKVIRDLRYEATFLREGYFMTTDAYSYMPIQARWCNPDASSTSGDFIFKLVDKNRYTLSADNGQSEQQFLLGDSIEYKNVSLFVSAIPGRSLETYLQVPFILRLQSARSLARSYISRLNVEWAEEGAGVINLSINGTNPEKEMDFLNGLIASYAQFDLSKKNETARRTINFIESQLRSIKDSLRIVEFRLERFGNSSRIKDMSAEAQRLFAKVEALEVQRTEVLIRKNYYDYVEQYLAQNEGNLDQVVLPSSVGLTDPLITSLLTTIAELQLEMKLYLNTEKGKNPLVNSKLDRIRELKENVKESVKTLRSTDKIKSNFLDKQLAGIEQQLSILPASERQLIAVQRNYSLMENLYVFLMQKLSEAKISEASNSSDILPVNLPMQGSIISPKPMQNYLLGGLLGLLIPIACFVIFELINNKVQSKEDIEKVTLIPFIGGVGHNTVNSSLIVKDRPKSGLAESFRALRSNLNFFTGSQAKKVFMVSSSISGEGKTFTTINLATVFALSGKRTLIVGADMRRPKIFQDFNRSNDLGLSTYLSGLSSFDEVAQSTEVENLFLVSGGPVPPNPSELLLTSKFEEFINTALISFDFVLIDTPPLALVTDAFVMSKFVDHTVFVMRQNYSPKEFVRSINEYYMSGKIKNISILLNDIYKSGLGYGYGQSYAYQYGYGYGSYGGYGYYSDDSK